MNGIPPGLINSLPTPALPPSRVGARTRTTNIDGTPFVYRVAEQEIFIAPSNPKKAFLLQKLIVERGGNVVPGSALLRIGYYMIGHKPRARGKWAWGQFAAMMTPDEMTLIMTKIEANGWLK
jgi:hypothetical protein